MDPDHRLQFDDAGGDLDEAQTQGIELQGAPTRPLRHGDAQAPENPVGSGVEEETQLVGCGFRAGCAVGGEMRFPGFDVVLGLTATAVIVLIKDAGLALEASDDEARVGPLRADFDTGDDALDPVPTFGAVMERGEAPLFVASRRHLEELGCAGFEVQDMAAQGRGRRDPEDVVDAGGAAPIENLGAAIMTVGAQQDFGSRPVGPDTPEQAAQKRSDLPTARAFGRTQHGGHEATLAVEDDDGLEAVFVVMGVEEAQLLPAVNGIEGVVDIEHDPLRHLFEGRAIQIDHGSPHPQQGPRIGQVLQPGDGRLRAEFPIGRREIERHLEHRIASKPRGVVAVFVSRRDHQHAKTDDVCEMVRDQCWVARIVQAQGQSISHLQALFGLAQQQ